MDNELSGLLPFLPDMGATIIIFLLVAYSYRMNQQQHERELARTVENAETMRQLVVSLMDCLRSMKSGANQP
jgi:hypothetical protein